MKELLINVAWVFTSGWATYRLLRYHREPGLTIAWLFFVISVPIAGPFIFYLFGPLRLVKGASKRKKEILEVSSLNRLIELSPQEAFSNFNPKDEPIFKLAEQVSDYPATTNNQIELLLDPQEALEKMEKAIEGAKKFIHLEYYIIANDDVTQRVVHSLQTAAERGVQVRILYDAFGSLFLKRIHFLKLIQAGGKVAGFLPLSAAPQRFNFNFRNHRKLLIVDGLVTFTGGTNIGREYLGRSSPNQWLDYSVMVQGPSCLQLEDVFARDWHFTTGEELFTEFYYPDVSMIGTTQVQVLESGPDSSFLSLQHAIFLMINSATSEIRLMTPYFIPDASLMASLVSAGLRGVKTTLLLPYKTDSPLVHWASRSFYTDLLAANVEIYEYTPKVLHAKLLSIDDRWSVLGSANMDTRSFKLNFELNLLIQGSDFTEKAQSFFDSEIKKANKIEMTEFIKRPISTQLVENTCRLLSPVL